MSTQRRSHNLLPWVIWGVAALSYAIAIINRSSLAALGPAAQQHFGIDATLLATFPVIQLVVYAGMQIPVGALLDRFGATTLVLIGGVLMTLGQIVMAAVWDVRLAILARILVGAGDACTFISVMRLLPEWFTLRQLPTVSQLTGLIGQAGQLVSVTPLAAVVTAYSWSTGFYGVAAISICVTLIGSVVLRDRPGQGTAWERLLGRTGARSQRAQALGVEGTQSHQLSSSAAPPETALIVTARGGAAPQLTFWQRTRSLWRLPGVRLAYWLHFTSPFAGTVFILLWGTPFLTGGLGLPREQASSLLSLTVLASLVASLTLGPVSSRFVEQRVWINVGITLAVAISWITLIVWPGVPPLWLVIVMLLVTPVGGPASMISFEVLRSHSPRSFLGFGTGLVNTAGFTAALLVILLLGLALDAQGAGSPERYTLHAFQWAFAVQIPFWVLGVIMIIVEHRNTKRWMQHHGRTLR